MLNKLLTWVKNLFKEVEVLLPTTEADLDTFLANLISKYALPATRETEEVICSLLQHMPPSVDRAPLSYLAGSVNKSMVNAVVYFRLKAINEERKAALKAAEPVETPVVSTDVKSVQG